jgi:CubicO group peptidase (beta-lactamase class C family)
VFGEGTLRAQDKVLSLYFPQRSATYDFTPIAGSSLFYARGKTPPPYRYVPPVAAPDGWKTGTLAEVGLDVAPLAELVNVVSADPKSVADIDEHGVIIARHGKIVFEEYFHGHDRFKVHGTRSAGKVVASLLVGAAMQNGKKLDTSTRVYDVLMPGAVVEPRKKAMTVEHLLTMSSGYDCDDWAGDRPGSEDHILDDEPDPNYYRYTLQLPMELDPGKEAIYCSINPNLVGAVVATVAEKPLPELFDEWIARPLQIWNYHLNLQPTGEVYLGGGARFQPRDFMKFGQLLLDGGMWNGRRVLPREYAKLVGLPHMTLRQQSKGMHYGYLWWTIDYPYKDRTITGYFASGNGGQVVMVLPDLDMIVASYGGNYGDRAGWAMVKDYIPKYVLPSLVDASR